jgi:hypothetical protein
LIAKAPTKERTEIRNKFNPEQWFLSQVETHIRTQPSDEKTPLCVDSGFLRAYVETPARFSLSDPRVEHVSSCNYCLHTFLETRAVHRQAIDRRPVFLRHRLSAFAAFALAGLLIGFLAATLWNRNAPQPTSIQSAELRRTLDLSEYGTPRGDEAVSVPDLSLPAALVKLQLILPRLSDPGNYFVMVGPDKSGQNRIACAKAVAVGNDPRTLLTVTLDLSSAKPGKYTLSTEREGEGGPYFYPLTIESISGR